jgi:WD40 repeat protein
MVFNVNTQSSSTLSLSNGATPLSASLSPDGTLLFVGADDGTVHVIDTASGLDTQQVTFPFPTNELCFGPGNPPTQVPLSQVRITAVSQSGSNTAYSYSLISGPALNIGQSITIAGLTNGPDNGTYTITALGTDGSGNPTFTVASSLGVSASNQSGLGVVPVSCSPDLLAVKP